MMPEEEKSALLMVLIFDGSFERVEKMWSNQVLIEEKFQIGRLRRCQQMPWTGQMTYFTANEGIAF